jgi:hypothetical protein
VALDSSALLGANRRYLVAAAALGYYTGFWSAWIVGELVRKRTEWIADRASREGADRAELRRRLRQSRERVNALVDALSGVLRTVDYRRAADADLSWLLDPDDRPVMQTALAAGADTLVTDNARDFPPGQVRNGVLLMRTSDFLAALYTRFPEAESAIGELLADSARS